MTSLEWQLLSALEQCVRFINRIKKDDLPTIQEYREVMDVSYAAINAAGDANEVR